MAPTDPTPRSTAARPVDPALASTDRAGRRRLGARADALLAGLATLAAGLALIPGFTRHGLWSTGEIAVLQVGSSRVDLQACKLEYSIVSPK